MIGQGSGSTTVMGSSRSSNKSVGSSGKVESEEVGDIGVRSR